MKDIKYLHIPSNIKQLMQMYGVTPVCYVKAAKRSQWFLRGANREIIFLEKFADGKVEIELFKSDDYMKFQMYGPSLVDLEEKRRSNEKLGMVIQSELYADTDSVKEINDDSE